MGSGNMSGLTAEPGVGSEITFGGRQWLVLEKSGGNALILSKEVVEKRAYHKHLTDTTWEKCSLRQYLNGKFYKRFSAAEKARIMQTKVVNKKNPLDDTDGGNDTNDRVFLLSIEEVVAYFGDSGQLKNHPPEYVINDKYNRARVARDRRGKASWWWLRSPGDCSYVAALVDIYGAVLAFGGNVNYKDGIPNVRPALWINLAAASNATDKIGLSRASGSNTAREVTNQPVVTKAAQRARGVVTIDQGVGSEITFGGRQWLVLERNGGNALILSKEIVEERAYHKRLTDTLWERCSLRRYLNGKFYKRFSVAEKARIMQTRVVNKENPWAWRAPYVGNDTTDRVFLLSIEEVVAYFGDSGQLKNENPKDPYYIDDKYNDARTARDGSGKASGWWLRSPGGYGKDAALVLGSGVVSVIGNFVYISSGSGGVRPALWLNL